MNKKIILTPKGKEKLEKELEDLKKNQRPAVIQRIKTAKEYGDLSENAEYEDARNQQSFIEGRIQEVQAMLKNAEVSSNHKDGEVALGSEVKIKMDGEETSLEIVSSTEADPISGKISSESPIGSALMGSKAGEKVKANTPSGEKDLEVISVS